jgi:protoporphyrinogen oxidase
VEELESRCDAISGFALAGGSYRGVGVPNCLDSGEKAATKVLGEWGIVLDEDAAAQKRLY